MVTKMINENYGPLEKLTVLTGVMYLSDLPTINYELVRRQLRNMKSTDYTLSQWQDAARFLTGERTELETADEIYNYLLAY